LTKVALISLEWDVIDLIESIPGLEILGVFDRFSSNPIEGLIRLGDDDSWPSISKKYPSLKAVLALDPPSLRSYLFDHYGCDSLLTLISPHAYVSKHSLIGPGSLIQRGTTIMPKVKIGKGCKLNVNVTVHHEAIIGNFCTLAPSAVVLGRVVIEDQAYIGAGAVIRQRCRIGKAAVIGAGAVVVKDVPAGVTMVGVPARKL
jgi:sugar O-acyltransferase (sialic acid O-acetyltransferase NeuD family)